MRPSRANCRAEASAASATLSPSTSSCACWSWNAGTASLAAMRDDLDALPRASSERRGAGSRASRAGRRRHRRRGRASGSCAGCGGRMKSGVVELGVVAGERERGGAGRRLRRADDAALAGGHVGVELAARGVRRSRPARVGIARASTRRHCVTRRRSGASSVAGRRCPRSRRSSATLAFCELLRAHGLERHGQPARPCDSLAARRAARLPAGR